jgi:hypothetical protein
LKVQASEAFFVVAPQIGKLWCFENRDNAAYWQNQLRSEGMGSQMAPCLYFPQFLIPSEGKVTAADEDAKSTSGAADPRDGQALAP